MRGELQVFRIAPKHAEMQAPSIVIWKCTPILREADVIQQL
jgi:hypothetical protein